MMRITLLLAFLAIFPASPTQAARAELLDNLAEIFSDRSARIDTVQIIDLKPRHTQYWVVARGFPSNMQFKGEFEDELFGIFIVDEDLTRIEKVLDVFSTPRWLDYRVWIESHSTEWIEVRGEGATYKDGAMVKTFEVPE